MIQDIILVNPPAPFQKQYGSRMRYVKSVLPPLGLLYVASVLESSGYNVEIIDCVVDNITLEKLENVLSSRIPDVVGVTATTPFIGSALSVTDTVKKISKSITTLLGGPHVTSMPHTVLASMNSVDYVVLGEGEETTVDLLNALNSSENNLSNVKGLLMSRDSKIFSTGKRSYIQSLDKLPFPARHLVPMHKYRPSPANYRRLPATSMITSRGCPYRCAFCAKSIFGDRLRFRSPENIVSEIIHLQDEWGIRDIQFYDDTFTFSCERTIKICDLIIEKGLDVAWNCMARVHSVDEELLAKMAEAGCYQIGYGIESGCQRLLDMIHKDITLEQSKHAISLTRKAGIESKAFFMLGLPGETEETIEETINFSIQLDPDIAQFMLTTPFPGTKLFEMAGDYGKLIEEDYSNFILIPTNPVFIPEGLDGETLVSAVKNANRRFYYRPKHFLRSLSRIRTLEDVKRTFLAVLSLLPT